MRGCVRVREVCGMVVGCGPWVSALILPELSAERKARSAAEGVPGSQPAWSGSLSEAVEPQCPLLADSLRALALFTREQMPFLGQMGLIYQSTQPGLTPEMGLGLPGGWRGLDGFLGLWFCGVFSF